MSYVRYISGLTLIVRVQVEKEVKGYSFLHFFFLLTHDNSCTITVSL